MDAKNLIAVLELSVRRNGPDTPLTLGHLLNIIKMVDRVEVGQIEREIDQHHQILQEIDPLWQDYVH